MWEKMGQCYVFLCALIWLVSWYSLDKLTEQRRNVSLKREKDLSELLCLFVQKENHIDSDAAKLSLLHQLLIWEELL